MPYYLDAVVRRVDNRYQVVVVWNADDPEGSVVCECDAYGGSDLHYGPPGDDEFDRTLEAMGFRVVGGRGMARTVVRANSLHTFYHPLTGEWHMCDPDS